MNVKSDKAFGTLLVGVNGSEGSRAATRWASTLALVTSSKVVAVHVLTYNREFVRDLTLDTMRNWRSELKSELENAWTGSLRSAGVDCSAVISENDSITEGILEIADSEGANLIVVGSADRGRHHGRILGAVAYGVSHSAKVPVVIVPSSWSA